MSETRDAAAPGAVLTTAASVGVPSLGAPAVAVASQLGEQVFSSWDKRRDGSPAQLVPRFGRTQAPNRPGGAIRVAVLDVFRFYEQMNWSAKVTIDDREIVFAIEGSNLSQEKAAERAWEMVCLAAGRIGAEG